MITWPSSLNTVLVDGAQYAPRDNIVKSQFPGGTKRRRRFTTAYEDVSLRLLVSRAQAQILYDFEHVTCQSVLPFQWYDFRDPSRRPAIYAFTAKPVFSPAGSSELWYADLSLELRTPFNGQFFITDDKNTVLINDNDEGLTT